MSGVNEAQDRLTARVVADTARSTAVLAWRAAPWNLVALAALTTGLAAVPVVTAWLTRLVLDRLTGVEGAELFALAAGLAATGLVAAVLPLLRQFLGARFDRAVSLRAVDRLYSAVNSFHGLARFENPVFQDRLRMARGAAGQSVGRLVDGGLRVAGGALTAVGFLTALYAMDATMTLLVTASAVPALVAELKLSRRRAHTEWRVSAAQRREFFYQMLLSSLDAAKEIRLFGASGFLKERMLGERRIVDAETHRTDRREFLTQSLLALISAFVAGTGLVWAALAARRGQLTVGEVSMFVAAVVGVQSALSGVIRSLADGHQHMLMMGHYLAVVRAGPDLEGPPQPLCTRVHLPALRRGVEFRDVWFRYAEDHPWILRGVNLFLPYGEAVALVGQNGAGKSTLVKLLCRFYDPTRGAVLWDGVDIRQVPVPQLRRRLGAVFQDYVPYDLTAAENIAIGDVETLTAPDKIREAARRAGVHDMLSRLPRGYDTMLSRTYARQAQHDDETGTTLSGGQWQRLALARAFVRDEPDLLVLDEPSSGLDAEAEHDVHLRLRHHRAHRTSLLISHRLGAVRDADRIVVLADGRIAEEGTHDALLLAGGTYAKLFTLQASGYQEEA
ncbi:MULTISPECIES: ABC transporter ATP-binding protein [Streptomyces]|uniref:ABC transporter ATP-binding protein n=1 Tax=Streptomyces eurythermus TaxID=42237 RepID=A0ABW6YPW1_9ACTN|nr:MULTISPECIES: ABC transporter ATP-binding protein [Streptomyces]QIS74569.1 ABC transporter ATP-binding protein [Streptomyces sp. DSM 40868]